MNKKQQRQQKMLRQQEIVNAAKEAGRDLTAEEQTEFDSLQREIERLNGEIEAEEQQQRGMNPPANAPPQNPANPEADTQRAIQEERARIRSITELCGEFGMEARSYIESGATLDSVREAALEHEDSTVHRFRQTVELVSQKVPRTSSERQQQTLS